MSGYNDGMGPDTTGFFKAAAEEEHARVIAALRARVAKLEAALEAQRDHWRWIVKAYPNSGASATAGYALAAIDDAGG